MRFLLDLQDFGQQSIGLIRNIRKTVNNKKKKGVDKFTFRGGNECLYFMGTRLQPESDGGGRGKVKGSPESVGFVLWGP